MLDWKQQIDTCGGLLERSTLGVVAVNLDSKTIRYANKTAESIIGVSPLEGRDVRDFVTDPASRDRLLAALQLREHGQQTEYRLEIDRPTADDRKKVQVLVAGVPVEDDRGDIAFSFAVLRDLTIYDMAATIRDIAEREADYWVMLDKVAEQLRKVFPFELLSLAQYSTPAGAKVAMPRHARSLYDYPHSENRPPELRPPGEYYKVWYHLPYSPGLEQMALNREESRIDDLSVLLSQEPLSGFKKDPFIRAMLEGGYHSSIRIPLFQGERPRLVAELSLFRKGKGAFSDEDVELLKRLRMRAMLRAAYFAYRHAEEENRAKFQQKVATCARTIDVAELILGLREAYGWKHISIFRVDRVNNRFKLLCQSPALLEADYSQNIGEGVLGHVLQHKLVGKKIDDIDKSELRDEYVELPVTQRGTVEKMNMKSEMCVPVSWEGAVRWLVNVEDPRRNAFSDDDFATWQELLRAVGERVEAIALRLHFADVFELTRDALFLVDEQNNISVANPAALDMLGDGAVNRNLADLLPAGAKRDRILANDPFLNTETVIIRPDGTQTKVLISGSASAPDMPGRLMVAKDIGSFKRRRELEGLGEAFYEVAMQAQTPLSLAASVMHRLAAGDFGGESAQCLAQRAQQELNKVELTLEKMSLYREGVMMVPVEPISLDLRRQLDRMRKALPDNDQEHVFISGEPELYVRADAFRTNFVLRSILSYLLDRRAGGSDATIMVSRQNESGRVDICGSLARGTSGHPDTQDFVARLRTHMALSEPLLRKFVERDQHGSYERRQSAQGEETFTVTLPMATGD